MNQEKIRILTDLVAKDLQLENSSELATTSLDDFRKTLKRIVSHLLDHDFNSLFNALYRIDVSEEKVKKVFAGGSSDISSEITELILERQLQKLKFRMQYRSGS